MHRVWIKKTLNNSGFKIKASHWTMPDQDDHFVVKKFFNVFSCSKQNNGKNILKNSECLVLMTHDGNCCKDYLWFRHSQVVKSSFRLRFSTFLFCKIIAPAKPFFFCFSLALAWNNLTNIITTVNVEQNKRNKFPMTSPTYLYSNRSWTMANNTACSIHIIVYT